MANKQTVVEWIEKELDFLYKYMSQDDIKWFFDRAKQMEKEQMIDFLDSIMDYTKESHNILGVSDDREAKDYFEQYYNETYGTKKQDSEA